MVSVVTLGQKMYYWQYQVQVQNEKNTEIPMYKKESPSILSGAAVWLHPHHNTPLKKSFKDRSFNPGD